MRIALFADVHANREALEACLEHARGEGAERSVFLGDLVGYGADPEWTLEIVQRLHHLGAATLLGNHDAAVLGGRDREMHPDALEAVAWTIPRLAPASLDFLAGLPLFLEDEDRFYVHANTWKPGGWEYIHGPEAAARSLAATPARLIFCGHLHRSQLFHLGTGGCAVPFTPRNGVEIPLARSRRWLAVLGSVGQPRDGNPAAAYALHDTVRSTLTFHRVPFEVEETARKIRTAGLPAWLGARLERGI